tara:strand:+ start:2405 stop:3094 length:690 start_codon:yes stop_codon:yes gene_type:complete
MSDILYCWKSINTPPFCFLKNYINNCSGLFIQGSKKSIKRLEKLPAQGLAIVGTRKPSSMSYKWTVNFIKQLRESQFIIISGLAKGIDSVAHNHAIKNKLPTIAVLGSSHDRLYPKEHEELVKDILLSDGLILSEYPPGTRAQKPYFLQRNRLIAALSEATIVVEAPQRSGSINTAHWAGEFGKDVYTLPSFPEDSRYSGNRLLLEEGAIPIENIQGLEGTWKDLSRFL